MFRSQICWALKRLLAVSAKRSMASPAASTQPPKSVGDISSVFPSLKPGTTCPPLPPRFAELKKRLIEGHEDCLWDSWHRLLASLREETAAIKALGSTAIPELNFWDMHDMERRTKFRDQLRERGVAVIRGVVTEREAFGWKELVQRYIQTNPSTKGRDCILFADRVAPISIQYQNFSLFLSIIAAANCRFSKHQSGYMYIFPPFPFPKPLIHRKGLHICVSYLIGFPLDNPAVYELYWSPSQVLARAHPNLLRTQAFLMSHWYSADKSAGISTSHPVAYADRLRIRQPGDAGFALGPHIDGGSCERWEEDGYGKGGVYNDIFQGDWESYDPWESSCRLPVISDLYNGAGGCSMFRMFQGWLSMSTTGAGEGTLMVNPLFRKATAYVLLRPFFQPRRSQADIGSAFLDSNNWQPESETTSRLQGAIPSNCQELNDGLHPHLRLENTMVHVPEIRPGDYVAWHCDSEQKIHRESCHLVDADAL